MWIARLAWSLPILAAVLIAAHVAHLLGVDSVGALPVILLAGLDLALVLLVLHLFRVLRRGEPLTLTTTLLGMFGLGMLAHESAPLQAGIRESLGPVMIKVGLQVTGFVLTAWAWVRHGSRRESPSLRDLIAVGLLGLLAVWTILVFQGLVRTEGLFALRLLALVGLSAPLLLYFLHMARHLRKQVRLSDGMLLLGLFVALPAGYVGPTAILGRAGLPGTVTWLYLAIPAFAALAIAWSRGERAGGPATPPPLPPA